MHGALLNIALFIFCRPAGVVFDVFVYFVSMTLITLLALLRWVDDG